MSKSGSERVSDEEVDEVGGEGRTQTSGVVDQSGLKSPDLRRKDLF